MLQNWTWDATKMTKIDYYRSKSKEATAERRSNGVKKDVVNSHISVLRVEMNVSAEISLLEKTSERLQTSVTKVVQETASKAVADIGK